MASIRFVIVVAVVVKLEYILCNAGKSVEIVNRALNCICIKPFVWLLVLTKRWPENDEFWPIRVKSSKWIQIIAHFDFTIAFLNLKMK